MPLRRQLTILVSASIVKFFDVEIKPPRGGWNFPIGGETVLARSEGEIFDALKAWQKNNSTFVSDEATLREMWDYWCQRESTRCGMLPSDFKETAQARMVPRAITKELQGPPIWTFLNTLAAQWSPGLHPYFLDTCNAIHTILECPDCQREWRAIMHETPPTSIKSRLAACQWVNAAHNIVNRRRGVSEYSYARMVREWGAPIA